MKNKRQLIRFALVGGTNTLIDIGLLFGLVAIGLPKLTANTISTGIAFVFSFFANRHYTFKASGAAIHRQIILFIIVTLFGLWVLQNGVIYLIQPWIESVLRQHSLALFIAKLIATGVSLVWNYVLYDQVVFTQPRNR